MTTYEICNIEGSYVYKFINLSTSGGGSNLILAFPLQPNSSNNISYNITALNKSSTGSGVFSGIVSVLQGNVGAGPTIGGVQNSVSSTSLSMLGTGISLSASANTVNINATGLLSNNINWGCLISMTSTI